MSGPGSGPTVADPTGLRRTVTESHHQLRALSDGRGQQGFSVQSAWHGKGQGFESPKLHKRTLRTLGTFMLKVPIFLPCKALREVPTHWL
jgi:hypothetical protein